MTTRLNPYLSFRDNAREAMGFYQSVFGGELTTSTFGDYQASDDPADKDKVMHSMLVTDAGIVLMGADTPSSMDLADRSSISISLSGGPEDEDELTSYWTGLSDGGTVVAPLDKAPWGDTFGMCVDRFGTMWMVNIAGAES
jgi:PhnB protein